MKVYGSYGDGARLRKRIKTLIGLAARGTTTENQVVIAVDCDEC